MISEFKICKSGNCGVTITGLEQDAGSYLDESSLITSFRTYKWSESVTMNIISSITADETEKLEDYEIKDHNIYPIDDSTFEMKTDGLRALAHLIIPSEKWIQFILERGLDDLALYSNIIYYDTVLNKMCKYKDGEVTYIVNEEVLSYLDNNSTVIIGIKNTFNLCHLNDCFYKTNKILLDTLSKKCIINSNIKDLSLKRDIIWMAINSIKYAIETQQLFEA